MQRIGRYDGNIACAHAHCLAIDGYLEFALDQLPDLLLLMIVLVDRGTFVEIVVREGHVGGIEKSPAPARQALDNFQFAGINYWHRCLPRRCIPLPNHSVMAERASRNYKGGR